MSPFKNLQGKSGLAAPLAVMVAALRVQPASVRPSRGRTEENKVWPCSPLADAEVAVFVVVALSPNVLQDAHADLSPVGHHAAGL